jgi:hypothetical protein
MAAPLDGERLAEWEHVTLLLVLVADRAGRLSHGRVVDPASREGVSFTGWSGLVNAVQTCLAGRRAEPGGSSPSEKE